MTDTRNEPPGEDGFAKEENLYARAQAAATGNAPVEGEQQQGGEPEINWLNLVSQAETQGGQFMLDQIKNAWDRSYKAFHNQHFMGSKYNSTSYKGRSRLFRPKTRGAVRKANASAAAALFSTRDAISCTPGNESDPCQRASAALMQEIINYRTDRTSGRAAIPWYRTAIGAHQDTFIMSACLSKQYWKLELEKKTSEEQVIGETGQPIIDEQTGQPLMRTVHTYSPKVDRPDCKLVPLENAIIDPGADWVDPVQSGSYFIVKWPMRIDEIRKMEKHPLNPWRHVDVSVLKSSGYDQKMQASGTRAARERGMDRMDPTATGSGKFEVLWVYEVFMRYEGQDITFWSAGSKAYLTDPKPVEEVYPEQGGERPYVFGIGSLETHRIFPMSHVESWQQLQQEVNDLANLRLDQVKQSVSPITFVKRGRQVDLAALQRRGPNSVILRTEQDDIEFAQTPEVPSSAYAEMERLNVDFDDQAGQFNSGSVQTNRSLNETVGGLNLISSAANSVQEFDLRTWVETWVEPVMGQLVRLEQYYESDEVILGLCGERAQLLQMHGVNQINDDLLMQQVAIRVDAGLGASNPQTKLGNFANALSIMVPVWQASPQVQSGEIVPDVEEMTNEVFSLAGYRDGAARFIKKGQPKGPPPQAQAEVDKIKSDAEKNRSQADLNRAKAMELGARAKMDFADMVHGQQMERAQLVNQVRTERENAQRDRVNDDRAQKNVEADRQMKEKESDDAQIKDLLTQLVSLLQGKNQPQRSA
ncbi:hypothetical protein I6F35_33680 [Bradyrhizobium sp. BRP22]|uniref:portal protein n=1 Tax=Bradyrhizobium sp. BRP22 TaxID=2793821 RepID=UPI001CD6F0D7|nr:hypothetical protein [Bradyrhizobium sp. BRP22]MCA1458087.1 hypothetical protein [Bradyrhizobium sp. BRP22]